MIPYSSAIFQLLSMNNLIKKKIESWVELVDVVTRKERDKDEFLPEKMPVNREE